MNILLTGGANGFIGRYGQSARPLVMLDERRLSAAFPARCREGSSVRAGGRGGAKGVELRLGGGAVALDGLQFGCSGVLLGAGGAVRLVPEVGFGAFERAQIGLDGGGVEVLHPDRLVG